MYVHPSSFTTNARSNPLRSNTLRSNPINLALGRAIATSGRTLIYGGGSAGLMGATSRACKAAGGKQVGIVPRAIAGAGGEGIGNGQRGYDPDETIFVESMHERKTLMAMKAGGGFVALPGGFGTFEEVRGLSLVPVIPVEILYE